ncbi:phytoene dehydrogenase-like oxidoreductase [Schinkia azotoformans MEV2011]|uniref:Pyridine nucleotide-disulfide oxidoreductase domain-containing protein 2 n=1 Tax=Schinkia azotoformans MEV2011 TaxID=1348973 RepID=A0A072NUR1_SCHAZ|nr:NAD(P)/FAD-dependent oxidoreductase [Schinkia azotoformans]KEF36990.1 phytoene dehydrogenase-like oxidoreductase [Schinkia azotoformans MEV2011]MEC1694413.1 NAD(P)/FAD-dependent oxidoreductase [Schinkia azotoformans]MEC1723224.1 NAD(P)/FAD-dependent oxidoreductase [Schinkia azotoformans]MEC1772153.1 NAD(P)/FAD-dependent oxidoreductase [Schinkia azotoformans]MEC1779155.1 NAD(P)/FAD-dependent oxidoreductase [Schinkia azotoformans]
MKQFDTVVIGSGINSLAAAAILSKKGQRVLVLEKNDWIGGCIKTSEITAPGFKTDVFSGWHPLFVTGPVYRELKEDLEKNGLEYVNTEVPTGVIMPNNESAVLYADRQKNIQAFNQLADGDGVRYQKLMENFQENSELVFHLLTNEPTSWSSIGTILKTSRKSGFKEFKKEIGLMLKSADQLLNQYFESDVIKALFAPWILHTGLGPNDAAGNIMMQVLVFSLEAAGMPIPKGGGDRLVKALMDIVEQHGGEFTTNEAVEGILVQNGIVQGVQTRGQKYSAKYVLANVTPHQLYDKLLPEQFVPSSLKSDVKNYRYGNAAMQIHYALDGPLEWANPELKKAAMINLTSGINGVSQSVNEVYNGLLPKEGTIAVGQHTALDPTRAPEGKHTLWIQLLEMPRNLKGDAAGEIDTSQGYTKKVIDAYVDRIERRICNHAPNFKDVILSRKILSPLDLEAHNQNLVGGDPYSGAASIDQLLLWRPSVKYKKHHTPVKNLFHIGASTHPGPGLGGVSGYLAAQQIK